jgi:hypothetical protein
LSLIFARHTVRDCSVQAGIVAGLFGPVMSGSRMCLG